MPKRTPVTCYETGETFESIASAARSLGISSQNFCRAIEKGYRCGGYHWHHSDKPASQDDFADRSKRSVTCWETGETYESTAAAAAAFACSPSNIQRAAQQGSRASGKHWFYADQPRPDESDFARGKGRPPRPIVCVETGVRYRSLKAAAASLGTSTSQIGYAAKTGSTTCGYHWRYDD